MAFDPGALPFGPLLVSTGVVALGEIGDKTQLLALLLIARFRRPWPIAAGILVATLANHAAAGWLGARVAQMLGPDALRWIVGLGFLAMAAWMLKPDELDDDLDTGRRQAGAFATTVVAFFLAEMGDKTQLATVALAARFPDLLQVVLGTTLGMMAANLPVLFLGDALVKRVPMKVVHGVAAAVFALLGLATLANVGSLFGAG